MDYVLASRENDWDTDELIAFEGKLYLRNKNGGSEGGRDPFRPSVELITRSEAVRLMLEIGLEPAEIAAALEGIE